MSGLRRIAVGRYRDHTDPMQIVSGRLGHEVVHYTAPLSSRLAVEMQQFLAWFEATRPARAVAEGVAHPMSPPQLNSLARAAMAHLWFDRFTRLKTAMVAWGAPLWTWQWRRIWVRPPACLACRGNC